MIADDLLEEMYALAHFLHHDPEVALTVTLAAADRLTLLKRQLDPPVRRLPDAWLPQYCVYLASDTHERAYEHPRPGEPSRERPTLDDYLVRYIKCLVWWTLDRPACHVAVALGCFLLRYQAGDPVQLVPVVCSLPPAQRIRRQLARQL